GGALRSIADGPAVEVQILSGGYEYCSAISTTAAAIGRKTDLMAAGAEVDVAVGCVGNDGQGATIAGAGAVSGEQQVSAGRQTDGLSQNVDGAAAEVSAGGGVGIEAAGAQGECAVGNVYIDSAAISAAD